MQIIIVSQHKNYSKTALKTILSYSNWYSIKKEVLLSLWSVYLPILEELVGLEGRFVAQK